MRHCRIASRLLHQGGARGKHASRARAVEAHRKRPLPPDSVTATQNHPASTLMAEDQPVGALVGGPGGLTSLELRSEALPLCGRVVAGAAELGPAVASSSDVAWLALGVLGRDPGATVAAELRPGRASIWRWSSYARAPRPPPAATAEEGLEAADAVASEISASEARSSLKLRCSRARCRARRRSCKASSRARSNATNSGAASATLVGQLCGMCGCRGAGVAGFRPSRRPSPARNSSLPRRAAAVAADSATLSPLPWSPDTAALLEAADMPSDAVASRNCRCARRTLLAHSSCRWSAEEVASIPREDPSARRNKSAGNAWQRGSGEGQPQGHDLVEHHAQSPNIAAGAVSLATDDLRRQVVWRADLRLGALEVAVDDAGHAEVAQLHLLARPGQEDVLRLDVPMQDAVAMDVLQGGRELHEVPHDRGLAEGAAAITPAPDLRG
eukprot:CAMPEP_0170329772 /NCGR_PEP_ID=MMETSP0116_2-20130129/65808_1 /TAXON_ID=400756 /ORGANISM="Durinskia baltica, Strain CSIRO CS-38" /LENGTH=442 /DNA_ID=CAMNT_0010582919 /DNA_START=1 /DNA_END=1332 /DNA_ORIENTATION=-